MSASKLDSLCRKIVAERRVLFGGFWLLDLLVETSVFCMGT